MKHGIAGVAPDMLAPVHLDRFMALFGVASRKSLVQWQRATAGNAQLALLDASSMAETVPDSTPCVIYIGKTTTATERVRNARWVSHLSADFTVSDLIDALDRAAVFLMDWSARQKAAFAGAAHPPGTSSATAAPQLEEKFQLTTWVSLEAPYNTGACVRAMALLTRAPINLGQLCGHSGLDVETARSLISSLHRRGVLRHSVSSPAGVPGAVGGQAASNRARPVRAGLIQRLTRWVGIGGRA